MSAITTALSVGAWLLRCKPCLAVLAAIALLLTGGVYGVTVEHARTGALIAKMQRKADAAATERDAQVAEALERKYGPIIKDLNADKATLQQKVNDYAKRKPAKAGAKLAACKLGDAAGLLRRRQPG
ncbi:hypothetical protein JJC00_18850 [Bradyrhizobium diazoefficiens]|uniref:hypothetical protein n=1 Tax=Bradyrhizobium diazoefficiens TaxID=1355477 RepID=UPI00190B0765|nr:hypothetical protein [Bradyrhizobium diazoefficiens]QQO30744.1 hypothetical protein JJC00_18850 [Bradyrhizobium diazoefficiens]